MRLRTLHVAVLVILAGCTSGDGDSAAPGRTESTRAPSTPAGDGASTGSPGNGSGGSTDVGRAPEESSLKVTENGSDATSSGDVDGYPELSSASIEGSTTGALFDLGFAREVPDPTPKATQMTVALSIVDSEGKRYLLNALGTDQGWSTTVVTSEGQVNFGGKFKISGSKVEIGIPWTDLGGPKPFNWIVSSAWTGDQSKGMSYAFDSIPNQGFNGFPEKG